MPAPKPPKVPLRNWCIVGVDPGRAPTMVALWDRGLAARFYDEEHTGIPDELVRQPKRELRPDERKRGSFNACPAKIKAILEHHQPDLVVMEHVWVLPKQGIVSAARFIRGATMVEAVARTLGLNVLQLRPGTWMKYHALLTHDKPTHRDFAIRKLPAFASYFTRQKDHDRADAALIALAGLQVIDTLHAHGVRKGLPYDHLPELTMIR